MFEETSQTLEQKQEMPEDIFGEEAFSESEEKPTEEAETGAVGGEGKENPEADGKKGSENNIEGPGLTIKYNGEEKVLTLEEARILAQKGMNYDHVVAERDTKYKRELDVLDRYAAISGMTREQYISFLEQNQEKSAMQGILQELSEEFPDAPEELLEELAKSRAQERISARERASRAEAAAANEKKVQAWTRFFDENPGISIDKVPEEVMKQANAGTDPNEAYLRYKLSELERKEKIEEKNKETKEKATGSLAGDGNGGDKDDFLSGFDSD